MAVIPTPRPSGAFPTWRAAVAVLFGALLLAGGARGEEEPAGPARRGFEPALMIGFGVHSQNLRGSQRTDLIELDPGRQGKLRFYFSEAEAALFSPTLTESLGLRMFVHGGGQLPFTRVHLAENSISSFNTRSTTDPQGFFRNCAAFPPSQANPGFPSETFPAFQNGFCEIQGRNETIVNGSLFAGLGFDVTLPFGAYQFHVRPSLNWFGQSLKGEALTVRNTTGDGRIIVCSSARPTFAGEPCNDETRDEFNRDAPDRYQANFTQTDVIRAGTGEIWMHGLGPRVEFDVEVAKVGNMIFEVFLQTGIYWILTDRKIEYSGVGFTGSGNCRQDGPTSIVVGGETIPAPNFCSPTQPGGQPIRGFYKSEAGPYVVQGGFGLRVVWRGLGW